MILVNYLLNKIPLNCLQDPFPLLCYFFGGNTKKHLLTPDRTLTADQRNNSTQI